MDLRTRSYQPAPGALLVATLIVAAGAVGVRERSSQGAAAWPHEPTGFRPIEQQGWADWRGWGHDPQNGYMSLVINQDGPISAPSAIQWRQSAGMSGGGDPPYGLGHAWYTLPANRHNRKLFVGLCFKVSAQFQGHSSGVQKLLFISAHGNGHNDLWLEVGGRGDGPLGVRMAGEFVGLAPINIEPNQTNYESASHPGETAVVISRGVWHRYELYVELPAVSGGTGALRVWIDGVRAISRTDLPMSFDANNGWVQVHHDPIWGGVGDAKRRDDYVWLDETYVSGP